MTTNQFNSFSFAPGIAIRATIQEGQPWFIASDVCTALKIINTSQAVAALDDDERMQIRVSFASGLAGNPNRMIVSEAGLYSLVFRSNKPQAKAFKHWVIDEVLPAIRKNSVVMVGQVRIDFASMTGSQANVYFKELRTGRHALCEMAPK